MNIDPSHHEVLCVCIENTGTDYRAVNCLSCVFGKIKWKKYINTFNWTFLPGELQLS